MFFMFSPVGLQLVYNGWSVCQKQTRCCCRFKCYITHHPLAQRYSRFQSLSQRASCTLDFFNLMCSSCSPVQLHLNQSARSVDDHMTMIRRSCSVCFCVSELLGSTKRLNVNYQDSDG